MVVLLEDPLPPPVVSDEADPPTLGERFSVAASACGNLAGSQQGCWGDGVCLELWQSLTGSIGGETKVFCLAKLLLDLDRGMFASPK